MIEHRTERRLLRFANHAVDCLLPLRNLSAAPPSWSAPTLRIHSITSVPQLREVESWMFVWTDEAGGVYMRVGHADGGHRLRMYEMCDFLLDADHGTVSVEHLPHVDVDAIEHMLIDQALPRLLSERGELVVHAGAVCVDGECLLLLGQSRWGKSTLAASFLQRGHTLLSDDCVVLRESGARILAMPTYPSLRMFDDSIASALGDRTPSSPVAFYTGKRRIALAAGSSDDACPVRSAYVLNDPEIPATTIGITPLAPMNGCMALIRHGFRLDVASSAQHRTQLQQASMAASHIPVYALSYPRQYDQRGEVVDHLLAHVRSL